jgi:hypothetical protein
MSIIQGDYCKLVEAGSQYPVVIAFSSVNTPRGRFKPYRIVAEAVDINIIFVNDVDNRWYQHGIPGVDAVSKISAQKLVDYARGIGNGRVVTFGTSMGGFGAALFAALGGADGCLAFGLESVISMPGSRSSIYMPSNQTLPYPDLRLVMQELPVPTLLYASESDEVDLINIVHLSKLPNVTAVSVVGMEHPGVQVFDLDQSIQRRITSFAAAGGTPEGFEKQGTVIQATDLIDGLWSAYQAKMVVKDKKQWLQTISDVAAKWPDNATVQLRLGEARYANSDGAGAESAWRAAISICPYQFESMVKLGGYLRRRKNFVEAKEMLMRAIKINPWSAFGYYGLGVLLADLGDLADAENHLRKAVFINRGNKDFRRSLADVLIRSSERKKREAEELLAVLAR